MPLMQRNDRRSFKLDWLLERAVDKVPASHSSRVILIYTGGVQSGSPPSKAIEQWSGSQVTVTIDSMCSGVHPQYL
jgi:hypothetical protein